MNKATFTFGLSFINADSIVFDVGVVTYHCGLDCV